MLESNIKFNYDATNLESTLKFDLTNIVPFNQCIGLR